MKASATRAKVAPRCRNSAPDSASEIVVASTAGGAGSFALPTKSAAINQVARNRTNDRRRSTSFSRCGAIERPWLELLRGADKIAPADFGQHAIEHARIGFFLGNSTARDSFPIAIAISAQGRRVGCAGERCDRLPVRIRIRQNVLRL